MPIFGRLDRESCHLAPLLCHDHGVEKLRLGPPCWVSSVEQMNDAELLRIGGGGRSPPPQFIGQRGDLLVRHSWGPMRQLP
jgi:hypothetical protein